MLLYPYIQPILSTNLQLITGFHICCQRNYREKQWLYAISDVHTPSAPAPTGSALQISQPSAESNRIRSAALR